MDFTLQNLQAEMASAEANRDLVRRNKERLEANGAVVDLIRHEEVHELLWQFYIDELKEGMKTHGLQPNDH